MNSGTRALPGDERLDFLRLRAEFGKRAGNIFYAVGASGVLLLSLCFALLVYPREDALAHANRHILHENNLWQLNARSGAVREHAVYVQVMHDDDDDEESAHNSDASTTNKNFAARSHKHFTHAHLIESNDGSAAAPVLLGVQQEPDDGVPISTTYFEAHITPRSGTSGGRVLVGLGDAAGSKETKYLNYALAWHKHVTYTLEALQELGLCGEGTRAACALACAQHGGEVSADGSSCTAAFTLTEACFVADMAAGEFVQRVGCFGEHAAKYGAWRHARAPQTAAVPKVTVTVRDVHDPLLTALQYSLSGLVPHRVRLTRLQNVQKALFGIGASILIIVTSAMTWMRLSRKLVKREEAPPAGADAGAAQFVSEISFVHAQ